VLNNITIKSRLVFVIGFLSLLLVAIGVLGLFSLSSTNESLRTVYEDRLVALGYLDTVATKMNQNQIDLNEVVAGQLSAFPPPVETVDKILVDVRKRIEEIETTWKAYRSTYATDEEEKLSAEFDTNRRNYGRLGVIPAIAAISAHDFQQAGEVLQGPLRETFLPAQKTMADLVKLQTEVGKQQYTDSQTRYARVRIIAIVSILIGVGLAAIVGYWLIRAITGPLNEAVRIAEAVAAGDLTQRIEVRSTDETGQLLLALKDMNESLGNIVGQVRTGTETITVASRQIATGNADLSSRTESQASSLEETASSMEELTSTVKQNAENARQANQLVASTAEIAAKGGTVVNEVVETMASIKDSSRKIADIIGVIDGIAFQTNILALNAAVEAARAGEQGRGFAVVASEVRSLAQRSAGAAKEIKTLIEDSVGKVDAGGRLVDEAGHTMDEIVTSVKRVTDIMSEIAAASHEQSAGIEQVNQAVGQMDEMTQQNAALVEEAAAAAESLREQAVKLAEAVSVFRVEGVQRMPAAESLPVVRDVIEAPVRSVPPVARPVQPKKVAAAGGGEEWEEF